MLGSNYCHFNHVEATLLIKLKIREIYLNFVPSHFNFTRCFQLQTRDQIRDLKRKEIKLSLGGMNSFGDQIETICI